MEVEVQEEVIHLHQVEDLEVEQLQEYQEELLVLQILQLKCLVIKVEMQMLQMPILAHLPGNVTAVAVVGVEVLQEVRQ